ncbi:MAG: glycosyltransferase [Nocardioidaceae bacterium]
MSPRSASGLDSFLSTATSVLVVRDEGVSDDAFERLGRFTSRATHVLLTGDLAALRAAPGGRPDAVVVVLADRVALRRAAGAAQRLPSSRRIVCVLEELGGQPPVPVPSPAWPALVSLTVETDRGARVMVELAAPIAAGLLVAELARRTTVEHLMSPGWPVLGARTDEPTRWPPGDALAVVDDDDAVHDVSGDYPADLLLLDSPGVRRAGPPAEPHAVTGRVQEERVLGRSMSWADYERLPLHESLSRLQAAGPAGIGPVDEMLLNPIGFARRPSVGTVDLRPVPGSRHLLHVEGATETVVDTRRGPGDATVARLRDRTGVHLTWEGGDGPHAYARTVAALAMAGVPLTADFVPPWARALLDPTVCGLLETKPDLGEVLEREVHSVRLRRAALGTHGSRAWRRRLAPEGPLSRRARVSVLMATRRPAHLAHSLRQVGRQRGVELELLLATHGFTADTAVIAAFAESSGVTVDAFAVPAEESFGRLLNLAAGRATGDVLLKMDDDDWYGPDFVSDLLLARDYTGADVVGCPPEFMFVEPLWVTVRRRDATEQYRPVVAGGTMMVSHEAFRAVGGFRDTRKYVDANLFRAVRAAGGTIYRSHGLNYLLRRQAGGHTWEPGLGYFVSRGRSWQQWRGFRPSPLLELEPTDRPARTNREESPT